MRGKRLKYFVKPMTGEKISFLTKQYYVFPDGRLFDNSRKRFVAQYEIFGYKHVTLRDDEGKRHTTIGVHRLVVSVLQRLLCKGEVVHHKNHDRSDNRLENLEILTASEHQRKHDYENWSNGTMEGHSDKVKKAWMDGRIKTRNVGNSYNPAKQVAKLTKDGKLVKVWPSTMECQRNGFDHGAVAACCRGCYSTHRKNVYKGYVWQWYETYLAQQPTALEQFEARQIYLDF